jgi:hypothetical protein
LRRSASGLDQRGGIELVEPFGVPLPYGDEIPYGDVVPFGEVAFGEVGPGFVGDVVLVELGVWFGEVAEVFDPEVFGVGFASGPIVGPEPWLLVPLVVSVALPLIEPVDEAPVDELAPEDPPAPDPAPPAPPPPPAATATPPAIRAPLARAAMRIEVLRI